MFTNIIGLHETQLEAEIHCAFSFQILAIHFGARNKGFPCKANWGAVAAHTSDKIASHLSFAVDPSLCADLESYAQCMKCCCARSTQGTLPVAVSWTVTLFWSTFSEKKPIQASFIVPAVIESVSSVLVANDSCFFGIR